MLLFKETSNQSPAVQRLGLAQTMTDKQTYA